MTSGLPPRAVVVTRPTEYEDLLERHGTRGQAAFFLSTRGLSIDSVEVRHRGFQSALAEVQQAIPVSWRRASVTRADFCRFLFDQKDIVIAVGQDGLVANIAKYLQGQPVLGINPDREHFDGVLVPHAAADTGALLEACGAGSYSSEQRTMVEARLDDGQRILALNEIFVGCRSHQSARYRLLCEGCEERQSSSGLLVSTGTGATGWARSIHRQRRTDVALPAPQDRRLVFFVREAFPSLATGISLTDGELAGDASMSVISEMNSGGVIFGDGIEEDRLIFDWGRRVTLQVSDSKLNLVRR